MFLGILLLQEFQSGFIFKLWNYGFKIEGKHWKNKLSILILDGRPEIYCYMLS